MVWCGLLLVSDGLDLVIGHYYGHNDFTSYVTMPIEVVAATWVLVAFHTEPRIRRLYGAGIISVLLLTGLLLVATDPSRTFEQWITPMLGVAALAGSLHTLVYLSLHSHAGLTREGWFWVCLGMALFWFGFATVPPFAYAVMASREDLARAAYVARAWSHSPAYLLMTWGILCQTVPRPIYSSS